MTDLLSLGDIAGIAAICALIFIPSANTIIHRLRRLFYFSLYLIKVKRRFTRLSTAQDLYAKLHEDGLGQHVKAGSRIAQPLHRLKR